ncbi:hypothetical protein [Brevibacillus sp. DP1.3A]|uniref:hypothetical protein n=1 Tax=Brevibacillus sp. DP1.3A TaxID=2738867 RepID=UPI00156AE31B|nr:hypothetical protein [Brevibacillus sp. DP1.3A]UED73227.1 hypothetical protein HP399_021120 [Brevibacillus sp. DP1.3A]
MFDPGTSMNDIEKIIQDVINYKNNPKWITEQLDEDKFSKKAYRGKSDGDEYKLVIEDGSITTLYPYGWNEVED